MNEKILFPNCANVAKRQGKHQSMVQTVFINIKLILSSKNIKFEEINFWTRNRKKRLGVPPAFLNF